ncbi:helix-turn-helix transcriptional regulator [Roseibium sp. SCP14]|uniref:helix-turn-helix transcriptional regulator n=1 Tax=Roseibium sp. SCP14 TaxID=3141375 RepID=UPI0033363B55
MRKNKSDRAAALADGLSQCLIIPQGLAGFADAHRVMQDGAAAIFHKLISANALGVEFFSSVPCLCFVMRGRETFITPVGEELIVQAGEMILLPRNLHMVSNFTNDTGPLEAFLFFFDQRIVSEFQRTAVSRWTQNDNRVGAYKIAAREGVPNYMRSLATAYRHLPNARGMLNARLLELLHLVAAIDEPKKLGAFLGENSTETGKRNIRHLMRIHQAHNLSVADYALLSGRSVSSFNREFKRQFGIAPSQYLIEQRLLKAREAVLDTSAAVTDIALDAGYQNTSHFIAMFKNRFGVTPKRLRLSNL